MRALFVLLTLVVGLLLGLGWDRRPRPEDSYQVFSKTRCLTDDGLSFNLRYTGTGVAIFRVLPPQQPEAKASAKGAQK